MSKHNMSSEETIIVVEEQPKPTKITKNFKKLYQYELKRRKNAENSLEEKNNELAKLKLLLKEKEIEKYDKYDQNSNSFTTLATNLINKKHTKKQKRDIWSNSEWNNISNLENDDVGRVGEEIIDAFCKKSQIDSDIDGTKTKQQRGGIGDGKIKGKTCEIKTARLGSSGNSFQHELGENPWNADYMIFLDIAPEKMYISLFQNFTEEFYKKSGVDSSNKCSPYFPTKSVTWRKQKGAFKLDTSININETNNNTFIIDNKTIDYSEFKSFIDNIIQ